MIDEATPATMKHSSPGRLTLGPEASTTTVHEAFYFAFDVKRKTKHGPEKSGSTTSLALDYLEEVNTGPSDAIADRGVMGCVPVNLARRSRNAAAIALLERWLADDSGYDQQTWPALKKAIEESRTSKRKRFRD